MGRAAAVPFINFLRPPAITSFLPPLNGDPSPPAVARRGAGAPFYDILLDMPHRPAHATGCNIFCNTFLIALKLAGCLTNVERRAGRYPRAAAIAAPRKAAVQAKASSLSRGGIHIVQHSFAE
jgi:hypothetical protein